MEEGAFTTSPSSRRTPTACSARSRAGASRRRHPLGIQLRIEELLGDHVIDEGGNLWHRRIEEVEAAAAALCAHRYAVGHAPWIGDAEVVLPGADRRCRPDTRASSRRWSGCSSRSS